MKNYKITEKQLKMIIEQVDDEQKNDDEKNSTQSFFGLDDKEVENTDDNNLPQDDPIQQFFNSLV